MVIRPQPGPQTQFLSTPADIAVYGGAAGGGKTFALLLDFLRHIGKTGFNAVIFRRTGDQIRLQGGLWEESRQLYASVGGRSREEYLDWKFPAGSTIQFDSLQHEKDKLTFQGAQICGLGFDELTHFTESQFFYLLSRNRSICGIRPYVRATTNPDASSWVKRFLAPWLRSDESAAASGEIRWFKRDGGVMEWVPEGTADAKSVTFIRASVLDNTILLGRDPGYIANLKALSLIDRRRLLDGDWDATEDGLMFRREWFSIGRIAAEPATRVRFWDLAGTEAKPGRDPDYTVGVLLARGADDAFVVEDVRRVRERPLGVRTLVLTTAESDGEAVSVRMEQEPGSAGVAVIEDYERLLAGFDFRGIRSTGPKTERAKLFSAQCEAGNVRLLEKPWNGTFLEELLVFPSREAHDDQVDAVCGAFREIVRKRVIELSFS